MLLQKDNAQMKKLWIVPLMLIAPLLLFRFSPHGGIVPIWSDTAKRVKFLGGSGLSEPDAVIIKNGTQGSAHLVEIVWLQRNYNLELDPSTYVAERFTNKTKVYDVFRNKTIVIFFDISGMR